MCKNYWISKESNLDNLQPNKEYQTVIKETTKK